MKKEYEHWVALSYANKDEEKYQIATKAAAELESIFQDGFFWDRKNVEELSKAEDFKEKLRKLFGSAKYAVILWSDNYIQAPFAQVELEKIYEKERENEECCYYIIDIGGDITDTKYHNQLDIHKEGWEKELKDIIHNRIKKNILKDTIASAKEKEDYGVYVQTLKRESNLAQWHKDYDWNLFALQYVGKDGKEIANTVLWGKTWDYIEDNFKSIMEVLPQNGQKTLRICLNCHLSIAFMLGYRYGDMEKRPFKKNLQLYSGNQVTPFDFRGCTEKYKKEKPPVEIYSENSGEKGDVIYIISLTNKANPGILKEVKLFLEKESIVYSKVYLLQQELEIHNPSELMNIAEFISDHIFQKAKIPGQTIHLFMRTMAPLAFLLGGKSDFWGHVQLYDFFQNRGTYGASLKKI